MYSLIGSDFSDIILVTIFSRNRYLIFKNCLQAFKGYYICRNDKRNAGVPFMNI